MMRVLAALILLVLPACGTILPPSQPSGYAWGIPYRAEIVPDGTFGRFDAYTVGYRVQVEAAHAQNVRLVAHELAHIWQHRNGVPRAWQGGACAFQPDDHCSAKEAHADAVGMAVYFAGCETGDLGWPGGEVTGCTLPDPRQVTP